MRSRLKQEFEVTEDPTQTAAGGVPESKTPDSSGDELRQLGITTEERVSYLWNGYRYSNAGDAIAAAKRAAQ